MKSDKILWFFAIHLLVYSGVTVSPSRRKDLHNLSGRVMILTTNNASRSGPVEDLRLRAGSVF